MDQDKVSAQSTNLSTDGLTKKEIDHLDRYFCSYL